MQRFGKIIKQINRRQIMETETFECSFKRAFEKDDGGVTVYITKDDGTDMTVYGEALGASRWQKGARLGGLSSRHCLTPMRKAMPTIRLRQSL